MKKMKYVFAFVLAAVLCVQTHTALAATEFSDGVYTLIKTEYNNVLITDCNLTEEKVTVPEFVLGYPVAGIGGYAFFSNSYVKEVTLPPAVVSIGEYAFANNEGLEYVTIPRWCETIADNAFWNSPNVIIRCYYGSPAYDYASEYGIARELSDGVPFGDTNADEIISISDVTSIQRHIAQLETLDGIYLKAADVDDDGIVNIVDATAVQKFIAELDVPYPIGEIMK